MLEQILPAGVACAELFADPPELTSFPGEESLVAMAVEKRRREVIGARHCARLAMEKLGVDPVAVPRGHKNAPVWPRGVVGSLTHCDGYRGAALGYSMQFRSIGIDAEPLAPLPEGVLEHVSLEPEREWLDATASELPLDKLLFSAKEATYKAWFPLTGRWLGFEEAHLTFTFDATGSSGTFHSALLVPGDTHTGPPLTSFDGRWLADRGLVITAIATE